MTSHEFMVSAAHKSSGKTTLSIGLIAALRARGLAVRPGKKGPDYIDPMWLASAAGRPCYSFDFNTQEDDEILALFAAGEADVRLVEGNKGLYDSVDTEGRFSNAQMARLLDLPVILVLDVAGITRGVAPLLIGYRDFEPVRIGGVILNKVAGARHESKLRAAIEQYTDIPVLGSVPRSENLMIRERHLGLVPSNEHDDSRRMIETIREEVVRGVDLERVLDVTRAARDRSRIPVDTEPGDGEGLTIAIARDEAFGFYYADDLDRMTARGIKVRSFSPVHDRRLPDCDALFLGGGFPESFAAELAANASMKASVYRFAESGGAIYAECGGLMYLCRGLEIGEAIYPMVGWLPMSARMESRPVGRGLVAMSATPHHPWPHQPGRLVNAHEFHYSRMIKTDNGLTFAYDMARGHGANGRADGVVWGNTLAGYVHQRHTRSNPWLDGFVRFIRECKTGGSDVNQAYRIGH
jgi:cobyrinic acid a,c-diamide synthase